jgi:hypothetical protein
VRQPRDTAVLAEPIADIGIAPTIQRKIISPPRQRVTRPHTRRATEFRFSIGFVVASVRSKARGRPRPTTVSVSSRPSRSDVAAPGCSFARRRSRLLSSRIACALSRLPYAWLSAALTLARIRSGS